MMNYNERNPVFVIHISIMSRELYFENCPKSTFKVVSVERVCVDDATKTIYL